MKFLVIADGKLVRRGSKDEVLPALLSAKRDRYGPQYLAEGSAELMDTIQKELLEAVSGSHEIPVGAYNIHQRQDGSQKQHGAY